MKYLLDTQIAIWSLEDHPNLTTPTRTILENSNNTLLVSPISLIEISIKFKLGKLPDFVLSVEEVTRQRLNDGFEFLPVELGQIYPISLSRFTKITGTRSTGCCWLSHCMNKSQSFLRMKNSNGTNHSFRYS